METVRTIFGLQVTLLLLVAAGAGGRKIGVITEGFSGGLSEFLMKMVLPCSIFSAFLNGMDQEIWWQSAQIIAAMVVLHIFYILLGAALYRKAGPQRQAILKFAVLCPNTNFMGMPVVGGIYGNAGVMLLSVALVPARIFIMTVGISFFLDGGGLSRLRGLLRNPSIWAVAAGVTANLLGLKIWEPLGNAISALGRCNTPLAMVLIGTVVASMNKEMAADRSVWRFCLLRLILIPGGVLAALWIADARGMATAVTVTMSALPAGAMTVIFSKSYGQDSTFAAACVVISTLVSVFTIPLVNAACGLLMV